MNLTYPGLHPKFVNATPHQAILYGSGDAQDIGLLWSRVSRKYAYPHDPWWVMTLSRRKVGLWP